MVPQAVKSAAHVRQQAVNAFDGLIPIFSDVELFLGTFPGDVRIRRASVDLIATTLDAVERAIGFFISNECESRLLGLQANGEADVIPAVKFGGVLKPCLTRATTRGTWWRASA